MAAAFGLDLRQRVVAAVVEEGLSTYAAARRFAVGSSTVGAWVRQRRRRPQARLPGPKGLQARRMNKLGRETPPTVQKCLARYYRTQN